jgi:hypothetical protein
LVWTLGIRTIWQMTSVIFMGDKRQGTWGAAEGHSVL